MVTDNTNTCVVAEDFILPSKGLVYDPPIDPHIKLQSMTTRHEMLRLSPSEFVYKNMADILDECILTEMPFSAYDLCIGDFQFLIHKLRIVTYGSEYKMMSDCPYCGTSNVTTIDLETLSVSEYSEEVEKYKTFTLPVSGNAIELNIQTPRMLDDITVKTKDFKKKTNGTQPDQTLAFTIEALVGKLDGKAPNKVKLIEWVRNLPMKDTNTFIAYSNKYNNSIGVQMYVENKCSICEMPYTSTFRATSEFFRPALNL